MPARAYKLLGLCGALFVVALAPYVQTAQFEAINFDDPIYLEPPSRVPEGLTAPAVAWAFTTFLFNWHPLTWMSLMLDFSLFGGDPGAIHLHSAVLHALNAVLLLLLLVRATGRTWPSVAAAALFAVHPLRVEAVVWISARKDLLSALFWLLTTIAYVEYARRRDARARAWPAYALAVSCLVLGLMAKGMLVSLPVVLLLMDFWPLRRGDPGRLLSFERDAIRRFVGMVVEKIPLLFIVVVGAVVTFVAQWVYGAVVPPEHISIPWRLANATLSYVVYLRQLVWPTDLSVFYPHPALLGRAIPWGAVAAAGGMLLAITVAAVVVRRRHPYLLVGWLWYLVALLPVVGIVQIGQHAHADRYTYLPHIGVIVALVWLTADAVGRWRLPRWGVAGATMALVVALAVVTHGQASHWRNSETLFAHATRVTPDSFIAHNQLGLVYAERGDMIDAAPRFDTALRLFPPYAEAHNNFANTLVRLGDDGRAGFHYLQAIQLNPKYVDAVRNWASLVAAKTKPADALPFLQRAVELHPGHAELRYDFGVRLAAAGRVDPAIEQFQAALRLKPGHPDASLALAQALAMRRDAPAAVAQFRKALEVAPDSVPALKELAWLLATHPDPAARDGRAAVAYAERAVRLTNSRDADAMDNLAVAYAEAGRFDDAIKIAEAALALARASGANGLSHDVEERLAGYRSGKTVAMMRGTAATAPAPATTAARVAPKPASTAPSTAPAAAAPR